MYIDNIKVFAKNEKRTEDPDTNNSYILLRY